jgi:hypothetical protein
MSILSSGYPLSVDDQRELPEGYDGPLFIWDVDKTYLSTHFSSGKGLARIPFEFAVDKKAIAGMPEVLRGLRRGAGETYEGVPLYFVTASPPQLKNVLEQRMLLDGVEYDGITYKDWARTFLQMRPGRIHEQVGFKLCALLEGKGRRLAAHEYLFGDDAEMDPVAYTVYAAMISGELDAGSADESLKRLAVKKDDRSFVFSMLGKLPPEMGPVKGIFIHLEKGSPPEEVERAGPMVRAVRGACQLALALYDLELVNQDTVERACRAALRGGGAPEAAFERLAGDAVDRGLLGARDIPGVSLGEK